MCYMERIGLRELRQHASRYVGRAAAGEVIEISVRGRLVARLVPSGEDGSTSWDDLIAQGVVIPAVSDEGLLAEPPRDYGFDASSELQRMRDEER
jgi:prevent-host-death family protein